MNMKTKTTIGGLTGIVLLLTPVAQADILIGAGEITITPELPVAVSGQFGTRIAKKVESPCIASAVALEKKGAGGAVEQAVMVSCDLVAIRDDIQEQMRKKLAPRVPDLDVRKVFLSATHTHTAPVMREGVYNIPKEGVIQPREYVEFLTDQLATLIEKTWRARKPGAVSWGLGHAVVAQNRRRQLDNGTATMYGSTAARNFRNIEGYEDHSVDVLFFWNAEKELKAMAVNVACPAQEVEGRTAVNADYWHETRVALREKYGSDLTVLAWIGAAGDQSPHLMWNKAAEARMLKARGLTRLQEIARRIAQGVDEAYDAAKDDLHADPPFSHRVKDIKLPRRIVTDEEYAAARKEIASLKEQAAKGRDTGRRQLWHQKTVDRFEDQKTDKLYPMELHAIRIGDAAICTNPFELFTDYGIRMKSWSKATQTFVVQLACSSGYYVATHKAVLGGGYSAIVNSNLVGSEGGDVLVDQTVEEINAMWPK